MGGMFASVCRSHSIAFQVTAEMPLVSFGALCQEIGRGDGSYTSTLLTVQRLRSYRSVNRRYGLTAGDP
jgi:hypothetical protein